MTNREHKKLLRAIRHQQAMRDNQQLARKIDRAFTRLSEDCSERVVKAVTGTLTLRNKPVEETGCCLPQVALFNAGHRKSERNLTAR